MSTLYRVTTRTFFLSAFFFYVVFLCGGQNNKLSPSVRSAEVKQHLGKPALFINNEPVHPIIYALTDMPGGRWSWEEVPQWNINQFNKAGFLIYQVDIWLADLWSEDGILDIALAQRQVKGVLDVNSDASIMLRIHVNAPRWWQNKYPAECTQFADTIAIPQDSWGMSRGVQGDLNPYLRHSFASKKYLQQCGARLKEFCEKFSQTPEGNGIIGLHIADGVFHEWHYWAFFEHLPDTGPAMTQYFKTWLREKYKTDRLLQKAWNDTQIRFDNVIVPGEGRLTTTAGVFRNPMTERRMIDYVEAQHTSITDAILHFCKIGKESWPRPAIMGVFYGYFFTMFGRQAAGGHLEMSQLLSSPYVDYFSAPLSYQGFCRNLGGSGQSRGVIESVRLNRKLWIDEMDQTTTIEQDGENLFIKNLPGDIAKIRRNIAQSYTRGMGAWYYDFGVKTVRGWWGHPDLMTEIKKLNEIFSEYHKKPFVSPADVLFVYDTETYYHMGYDFRSDPVSPAVIDLPSADAYHSGAAFHMIYMHDIEKVNLEKYKVVVFANTFYLNDRQKKFIREKVARDGRHLVWNYLPGYTNGKNLNISFVSEITGINLSIQTTPVKPVLIITGEFFPKVSLSINAEVSPLAIINDKNATALGYFQHDSASVAFARKKLSNSTSWVSIVPLSNPEVFREIFKAAGVHLYSEDGDVIYDGGGIFSVHTVEGGARHLTLRNGRKINITAPQNSTTIMDSETGEILIK